MSSRRQFIEVASAAALSTIVQPTLFARASGDGSDVVFNPHLLESADEIWHALEAMNDGGRPRFTGNAAHRRFVDMLESSMQGAGLQTARDSYTFPRWEARKWSLSVTPNGGNRIDLPVTFYYPHSGETGPLGVTGALVYGGRIASGIASDSPASPEIPGDLNGKIVFLDYEVVAANYNDWFRTWGVYMPDTMIAPKADGLGSWPFGGWSLSEYKKAGAVGVIFGWTNISDEQATGQNWPFGHANQEIPALIVGRDTGAQIRKLAVERGTATLTLEADVFENAGTDSLIATLPGASTDEVLIIYTHTDGPNAIQENGGMPLVALAEYFSKVPQGSRKRTLVFSMVTGHDYGAYVPGKQGNFIERHPDIVKKAVAAVTIEHLGCREWRDDESHTQYMATGKEEVAYAQTHHSVLAQLELSCALGTMDRRIAVVEPVPKRSCLGMCGSLSATGMPTLGYFPGPSYLNKIAPDGCISKLSKPLMYGQITAFAKLIHKLDVISASDLKWLQPTPHRGGAGVGI